MTAIERSTEKWEKYRQAMGLALARHDGIMQKTIADFGGRMIKHTGDGVFAVFDGTTAVACALELQRRFAQEDWSDIDGLLVRMGLHAGAAETRGADYFGPVINRTARLTDAAWGGQILATPEVIKGSAIPDGAVLKDLGIHLFADLTEPQMVFELTSAGLPVVDFPPIQSLTTHPHSLPVQATAFVGRTEEIAEISKTMDSGHCRLLTITGPGGIGKTRLAVQAAAGLVTAFRDGVYFVPLAPLATGSAQIFYFTIGDALKFSFYGQDEPRQQLLSYLFEKEMLLVLDNFEHLIDEAEVVGEIIEKCPGLSILVTSREVLGLQGEHVFILKGLDIPVSGDYVDPATIGAVQLFVQSAQRAQSDFALTQDNLSAIINICRQVDGLPLAIEIAATWVKMLTCREILQELARSIDFLTATIKDVPRRHRSLKAVFDYSWSLLSTREKQIYSRLALFRGIFRKEAARAVAQASPDDLSSLIDKSLLRRTPQGDFEILFVMRQCAEEKLDSAPSDKADAKSRFCNFYATMLDVDLQPCEMHKKGGLFDVIAEELDNIRSAWFDVVDKKLWLLVEKMYRTMHHFYQRRSWLQEGKDAFEKAVGALSSGACEELAVLKLQLSNRLAFFYWRLGNFDDARRILLDNLDAARRRHLKDDMIFCLNELAILSYRQGDNEKSRKFCEECIPIELETNDSMSLAATNMMMGNIKFRIGRYDEALAVLTECVNINKRLEDPFSLATSYVNLGNVYTKLNAYDRARECYEKGLSFHKELKNRQGIAVALNNLGNLERLQSHYPQAIRLFGESLSIKRDIGDRHSMGFTLGVMADTLLEAGDKPLARKYLGDALDILIPIKATYAILNLLPIAINITARDGRRDAALELARFVKHHPNVTPEILGSLDEITRELKRDGSFKDADTIDEPFTPLDSQEYLLKTIEILRQKNT